MFPFRFLTFIAARVGFAEDRRERLGEAWAELFVVGDVEACVERLVREPAVGVAGMRVSAVRVGEEPERVVEECAPAGVVLAVLGKATVHVREARTDAVLVPLEGVEVDRVGEVRGEQLVRFCFQTCSVRRQVSEFLVIAGVALVERRIHVSGKALVGSVADRDRGEGVRDEAFRDHDGHRPPGAVGLLRGSSGADEVGVGGAAWVGGEVQQHA